MFMCCMEIIYIEFSSITKFMLNDEIMKRIL
nr:MAG TPA: hypothetical protein [Caudoviricetes sp.]